MAPGLLGKPTSWVWNATPSMKTRPPTSHEIADLVSFLPRLHAGGFAPVKRWGGGKAGPDGALSTPWPEYDELVVEFFRAAGTECWSDYDYRPEEAGRMLRDGAAVGIADLDQIKTMLTYCVRGERFCDGHWAAMIEGGHVRLLLERLAQLQGAELDRGQ